VSVGFGWRFVFPWSLDTDKMVYRHWDNRNSVFAS